MSNVSSAIGRFEGLVPKSPENPFNLVSTVEGPATADEIAMAWPEGVLDQLSELWLAARRAQLFRDIDYGQWGLRILSPLESAARTSAELMERPEDFKPDDVVLGEFIGDDELLVVGGDGRILVALPLDNRPDWYQVASDLGDFLNAYWRSGGDKYWERSKEVG